MLHRIIDLCNECEDTQRGNSLMIEHLENLHDRIENKCSPCEFEARSYEESRRHMHRKHVRKRFKHRVKLDNGKYVCSSEGQSCSG